MYTSAKSEWPEVIRKDEVFGTHNQTERLGPIDREQECVGISEESGLFVVTYLPDEFNQRVGQQRLYLVAKIGRVRGVHLCRDLEAHAQALGDGDRSIGTLLGRDTAEKSKIRVVGSGIERVDGFSNAMLDGGQPVGVGQRFALIIRYRNEGIVVPTGIDPRQILQVEPAMQRGHGARRKFFEERKMDEIDVEMQKVEFVPAQMKFMQHGQMSGEVRFQRTWIEPNGLIAYRNQRRPRMGLRTGE